MKLATVLSLSLLVPFTFAQDKMAADAKAMAHGSHANFKASTQQMADDWKAAYQAKDADKIAAMYSSDAIWINAEGTFHGPTEIKAELKKMIDRGDGVDEITTTKSVHFGSIAYSEGTFSGTAPDKSGKQSPAAGSWVVSMRQDNGKWMLVAHTSVPTPGASSMAKSAKKPE
ncbi:MAG TPA: nuclear transport factor 2 family protein [Candidatus Sulfotelmatobacter sp.]|jgi:uncharacterized protein (TIGR02246 family)